ncbi:MAG: toll/interleukin-1 receptor domain-containing protein [Magnetococcus sp. DMHC-1]
MNENVYTSSKPVCDWSFVMYESFKPLIFISYCTRSKPSVALGELLVKRLEEEKFDTFLDRYDMRPEDQRSNEDIAKRLRQEINQCHGAVVLLSKEAKDNSDWVFEETNFLMAKRFANPGFEVLPVLIFPITAKEDIYSSRFHLSGIAGLGSINVPDVPERASLVKSESIADAVENIIKILEKIEWKKLPLKPFETLKNPQGVRRLDPRARFLPLIGRQTEMRNLKSWVNQDKPLSVRALIGGAGRGKTRLAMELGREVEENGWHVGFLSGKLLDELIEKKGGEWTRPTLAVIDYAAKNAPKMNAWLKLLASRCEKSGPPLRVLLFERHAEEGFGWWQILQGPGNWDDEDIRLLFDPMKPVPLEILSRDHGAEILTRMLHQSDVDTKNTPHLLSEEPEWRGEPLFAMMAGQLLADNEPLPKTRTDLAMRLAEREESRIAGITKNVDQGVPVKYLDMIQTDQGNLLKHLAAFVTLCGGLEPKVLHQIVEQEARELKRSLVTGSVAVTAEILHALMPAPDGGAEAMQPDIIGEAFILRSLGEGKEEAGLAAVQRAFAIAGQQCATTLVRCGVDFVYVGNQKPLYWLEALVKDVNNHLVVLGAIDNELPYRSLGLDSFVVKVRESMLRNFRSLLEDGHGNKDIFFGIRACDEGGNNRSYFLKMQARLASNLGISLSHLGLHEKALMVSREAVNIMRGLVQDGSNKFDINELAGFLNSLANRLNALGRHKEALLAVEEAVEIGRKLARSHPNEFMFYLSGYLITVADCLRSLGRHMEALKATDEAVLTMRKLVERRPGKLLPYLASFLNNHASCLSIVNRNEEALNAVEESINIMRNLVRQRPDAFIVDLTKYLNNLASFLHSLGRCEEALKVAKEPVELMRELVRQHNDVFKHDLVRSLNNFSIYLKDVGHSEEALKVTEEAVSLIRELVLRSPDAFMPDLMTLLNNLGGCLSVLGRREEALEPVKEAVTIGRELVRKGPETFSPNLVKYLINLAKMLDDLDRCEDALVAAEEAVMILKPFFVKRPESYKPLMVNSLGVYVKMMQKFGRDVSPEIMQIIKEIYPLPSFLGKVFNFFVRKDR